MNKTGKLLPPLGKAELEEFFGKIFKNYHIAFVASDDVFEISYDAKTRLWMRTRISRMLVTPEVFGYLIDRYLVIWKAHSEEVLLAIELPKGNCTYCLLPGKGYNFALRKLCPPHVLTYQRFLWDPLKASYQMEDLGENRPEGFSEKPYLSSVQHRKMRLYVEKESLQSVDNTLFYGYIEKYCL